MKTIITVTLLLACISGCAGPTWKEIIAKQTSQYTNEDGRQAFTIMCSHPQNCLIMAGMLCPHGYVKSGDKTTEHNSWSFRAGGGFANGGSESWSETHMEIVCRNKEVISTITHDDPFTTQPKP